MHRTNSGDRNNKCSFLHQQARYMKWWFPIRDLPNKLVKLIPEVFDQFKTEISHWIIFFYKCRNLGKTSSFVASHVQMVQLSVRKNNSSSNITSSSRYVHDSWLQAILQAL
jgi:hypothetical protein